MVLLNILIAIFTLIFISQLLTTSYFARRQVKAGQNGITRKLMYLCLFMALLSMRASLIELGFIQVQPGEFSEVLSRLWRLGGLGGATLSIHLLLLELIRDE